jgi:hypothetical protein
MKATKTLARLAALLTPYSLMINAQLAAAVPQPTSHFEDAASYFTRQSRSGLVTIDEYGSAIRAIAAQFDRICSDSFCAGDRRNLTALDLACSVDSTTQAVGSCEWVFAGSYTVVDPQNGALLTNARTFQCQLGFVGNATELTTFLKAASQAGASGEDGLSTVTIPGANRTLYDVLVQCL